MVAIGQFFVRLATPFKLMHYIPAIQTTRVRLIRNCAIFGRIPRPPLVRAIDVNQAYLDDKNNTVNLVEILGRF